MKVKKVCFLVALGLLLFFPLTSIAQIQNKGIATLEVLKSKVKVIRDGKLVEIGSFGTILEDKDQIETNDRGKVKIVMNSGDVLFLAPNARLVVNQNSSAHNGFLKRIFLSIWGKIRVQAVKDKRRELKVKTSTATIGVKGTDFVVEYKNKNTNVATIRGLVEMTSLKNNQSLFIPKGKMSGVNFDGKILPLEDIVGKAIDGVEVSGERIDANDVMGKKVSY